MIGLVLVEFDQLPDEILVAAGDSSNEGNPAETISLSARYVYAATCADPGLQGATEEARQERQIRINRFQSRQGFTFSSFSKPIPQMLP